MVFAFLISSICKLLSLKKKTYPIPNNSEPVKSEYRPFVPSRVLSFNPPQKATAADTLIKHIAKIIRNPFTKLRFSIPDSQEVTKGISLIILLKEVVNYNCFTMYFELSV